MKTFLWTTLFRIVVAIACLLCLGFGNLGTQVLENGWLASIMPKNLQSKVCDAVVASAMDGIDWCTVADTYDCNPAVADETQESDTLAGEIEWIQEPLSNIIANQEAIYKYLQDSVEGLNKSIAELKNTAVSQNMGEKKVDEKELQRLQLQAQIEALQSEMENL